MSDHIYRVGDLVTCEWMRDPIPPFDLLICRIGLGEPDHVLYDYVLLPVQTNAEKPRGANASDLTLVEAWRGPRLARCNADASETTEYEP